MKPAYEIVRAEELRAGDVIKENARDRLMTVAVVNADERCIQVDQGPPFGFKTQVFRQLPLERNPDVLMRALKIQQREMIDACIGNPIERTIEQAIRELESEGRDGTPKAHD